MNMELDLAGDVSGFMVSPLGYHFICNHTNFCLLQSNFNVDDIQISTKSIVEKLLGGNTYQQSKINQWSNSIVEETIASLTKQKKPFKYIGKYH